MVVVAVHENPSAAGIPWKQGIYREKALNFRVVNGSDSLNASVN
jgi:hypothetical protein